MNNSKKKKFFKAGHYEIHGETIAKFEFFDHGYNPYSRYLDVDKVDLILRKNEGGEIKYIEVQVKFGRLYLCGLKWEKKLFDYTSWRFFKPDEFKDSHDNLYIAYVMVHPEGYNGDIFIFPAKKFNQLINQGRPKNSKTGKKLEVCIARSLANSRWYLWKKNKFEIINKTNSIDVTAYRRNFSFGSRLKNKNN